MLDPLKVITCSFDTPCRRKNCSCSSARLSYTTFCKCEANTKLCQNTFTVRSVNELDEEDSIMVWACDAKGRDPYNKKHVEHDGDGNPTQRTSKDEMA